MIENNRNRLWKELGQGSPKKQLNKAKQNKNNSKSGYKRWASVLRIKRVHKPRIELRLVTEGSQVLTFECDCKDMAKVWANV